MLVHMQQQCCQWRVRARWMHGDERQKAHDNPARVLNQVQMQQSRVAALLLSGVRQCSPQAVH